MPYLFPIIIHHYFGDLSSCFFPLWGSITVFRGGRQDCQTQVKLTCHGRFFHVSLQEYGIKSCFHWTPHNPPCAEEEVTYQGSGQHAFNVTASRTRPISCVCACVCVWMQVFSMCFLEGGGLQLLRVWTQTDTHSVVDTLQHKFTLSSARTHVHSHTHRESERVPLFEAAVRRQQTIAVKFAVAIDKAASVLDFVPPPTPTTAQPLMHPPPLLLLPLISCTRPPVSLSCLSVVPVLSFLSQATTPRPPLLPPPLPPTTTILHPLALRSSSFSSSLCSLLPPTCIFKCRAAKRKRHLAQFDSGAGGGEGGQQRDHFILRPHAKCMFERPCGRQRRQDGWESRERSASQIRAGFSRYTPDAIRTPPGGVGRCPYKYIQD